MARPAGAAAALEGAATGAGVEGGGEGVQQHPRPGCSQRPEVACTGTGCSASSPALRRRSSRRRLRRKQKPQQLPTGLGVVYVLRYDHKPTTPPSAVSAGTPTAAVTKRGTAAPACGAAHRPPGDATAANRNRLLPMLMGCELMGNGRPPAPRRLPPPPQPQRVMEMGACGECMGGPCITALHCTRTN